MSGSHHSLIPLGSSNLSAHYIPMYLCPSSTLKSLVVCPMPLLYKHIVPNLTLEPENVFSLVTKMVLKATYFMTFTHTIFSSHAMLFSMSIVCLSKLFLDPLPQILHLIFHFMMILWTSHLILVWTSLLYPPV